LSLKDAFYSLLVVRTPSSFTFLFACFLKIWPRVTGFKLFEEFVSYLSVLLTAIIFLAASPVDAIPAELSTSSGAEPVSSLILESYFLLSKMGTELVESSCFESTRIKIWSRLSKSSFEEFVLIADS
jgi:hypothetical protein